MRSPNASAPMAARRSPSSRSRPRRPSCCSRAIRPTCCCSRSGSAAGSMRPMWSSARSPRVITPVSTRSRRISRRHARGDRRREGRHPQARRAGGRSRRRPTTRSAVIERRGRAACARRCMSRASTGTCTRSAAASSIRTRTACSTCRRRSCSAAISSTMPAPPSRRCARPGVALPRAARSSSGLMRAEWPARLQRLTQGTLVGARARGRGALARRRPQCRMAARAIAAALGDLEERVSRPLVLIVGMLTTKDCEGFLRNFAGLARRVFARADPHQDKGAAGRRRRGRRARRRHAGGKPRRAFEAALAAIGAPRASIRRRAS